LVLDVAHNPHSVAALFQNLDAMGFCPQTHAVFGAMADKDLDAMLTRMIPLVTHWHVCDLPSPRAARAHDLASILKSMAGVAAQQVFTHDSPAQALAVARENADPTDRIVVFGSFLTVGGVIENGLPNLNAPHLSN
jgi:dihydrofolate synthase/folylpolyglutamate synthase